MTLAGNTVYPFGSIDVNFDPSLFPLESTFNDGIYIGLLLYLHFMFSISLRSNICIFSEQVHLTD